MQQLNTAQQLYAFLGVDPIALIAHERGKSGQHRKKGPGRAHQQGKKKEAA